MRPLVDFSPTARIQVSFLILSSVVGSIGDDFDAPSQDVASDIA